MGLSYKKFTLFVMALAMVCISLAAWSKKDRAATQVVARVDGEEISIHQVNRVLSRAQAVNAENLSEVKLEILESLVDQQLPINLAMSKKLDRSPDVVTGIEKAKREIIARAVIEQVSTVVSQPSDEEAKKYLAENPALFSESRLFSLQEIALPKTTKDFASIADKITSAKSMEEMSAWLQEKKIQFSSDGGTQAAEPISLEILSKLYQFKDGQIRMTES
jgi:EpsD family peptidyl-prolyl cis-trans isomerase